MEHLYVKTIYQGKVFENVGKMKQKIPNLVFIFALNIEDLHHHLQLLETSAHLIIITLELLSLYNGTKCVLGATFVSSKGHVVLKTHFVPLKSIIDLSEATFST